MGIMEFDIIDVNVGYIPASDLSAHSSSSYFSIPFPKASEKNTSSLQVSQKLYSSTTDALYSDSNKSISKYEHEYKNSIASDDTLFDVLFERLRVLVVNDRIKEARRLLNDISNIGVENPELDMWKKIIEAPRSFRAGKGRYLGVSENSEWLKKYSHLYQGMWIGLKIGELVAYSESLKDLREILTRKNIISDTTVIKIPKPSYE
jgi:hypothetical protein